MPRKAAKVRATALSQENEVEVVLDTKRLRGSLGYALAQATVLARKAFAQGMLEPTGLRPIEFSVLMLLLGNEAPAPKALSRTLNVPAPNITPVLDRLETRGLLRRAPDATDGRGQRVSLTAKGRRVAEDAYQRSRTMEDDILSVFTGPERTMLMALLARLNKPGASL